MYRRTLIITCKLLIKLLRLLGKNGSALPGLIIERLYPSFLTEVLSGVQKKIILVTGTNGKTTTTKMLVTALRGIGARVVTNTSGSNMTRGLIAALVEDMTYYGNLRQTDWFVFEMDEAYAPIFTEQISPKALVALNVLRDQLDRYGEIDITAQMIGRAAEKTDAIIYNQLDPLLTQEVERIRLRKKVVTTSFGVSSELGLRVKNEQSVHGTEVASKKRSADVVLTSVDSFGDMQQLTISAGGEPREYTIPLEGFHNALNAAAVVAALQVVAPGAIDRGMQAASVMSTPFGRGEKLHLRGKTVTVALVKNPSGFMSNLETFVKQAQPEAILFVINDRFADGRDVSWLWDVSFTPCIEPGMKLFASGTRGYDMALRLKQDNLVVDTTTSVAQAVQQLMRSEYTDVVIIPTYTALFEVRDQLAKHGEVAKIW